MTTMKNVDKHQHAFCMQIRGTLSRIFPSVWRLGKNALGISRGWWNWINCSHNLECKEAKLHLHNSEFLINCSGGKANKCESLFFLQHSMRTQSIWRYIWSVCLLLCAHERAWLIIQSKYVEAAANGIGCDEIFSLLTQRFKPLSKTERTKDDTRSNMAPPSRDSFT